MEGGEEEEEIRRPEQTKEEEGGVKHRGGWTMRGTSLCAVNRAGRAAVMRYPSSKVRSNGCTLLEQL